MTYTHIKRNRNGRNRRRAPRQTALFVQIAPVIAARHIHREPNGTYITENEAVNAPTHATSIIPARQLLTYLVRIDTKAVILRDPKRRKADEILTPARVFYVPVADAFPPSHAYGYD